MRPPADRLLGGAVLAAAALVAAGCVKDAYTCNSNAQCTHDGVQGTCEATTHYCSFPDPGCPLGHRYGQAAGTLSNTCIGGMADAGPVGPHPDARVSAAVDVLFLIDNSPSMSPKEEAIASQIKNFFGVLDAAGVSYHVGIATSDCGAQPPPGDGTLSGPLGGKCDSVTGDNGALQAIPCTSRGAGDFSGPDVQGICSSICPTPIAPTSGTVGGDMVTSNFIASTGGTSPTTNVPGNNVAGAFTCMAFVGDTGCGLEMQLEGMKRALDGTNPVQNAGFLRKDALLAVIILTDEDDCSTIGTRRLEDAPMTMDCSPGGSASPNWACFNPDYRCYAMGTQCTQPLDQTGVKTGCHERTGGGGMVEDISTYENFLDTLRPGAVLVDAIDSPPTGPVQIDQSDGPGTPGLNRSITNATCAGPIDPVTGETIVGKPQVRLHDFVQHFGGKEYLVCDVANYPKVLDGIANDIVAKL